MIFFATANLILILLSTCVLKFFKRRISFFKTFAQAFLAALTANSIAFFLWKALLLSGYGYFWGPVPNRMLVLQIALSCFPVIAIAVMLWWSVKRQLK